MPMPVQSLEITDTYIEIARAGNVLRFEFASFPGGANTPGKRRDHIIAIVQSWLDTRQRLSDLPADDPDKTTDPARPDLFWEGQGGNAELVARSIVIEGVEWNAANSPPLRVTLRKL